VRPFRQLRRPALVVLTTGAVAALAIPAGAVPAASATKGAATSSVTILRLTVSGTTITAGRIAAVVGTTTSPHRAKLVVTPIDSSVTGPVGQQTITPTSNTTTVPATPKSVSLPGGLGAVTGPTFGVKAADDATGVLASAALKALGKVTVLTVPLNLRAASLSDVAKVTSSRASATKTLTLGSLSLPSLSDLLASLGLDLNGLLGQLTQGKLTELAGLVTSTTSGAVKTANAAVDAAQAAITGTVPKNLDGAKAALTTANGALTTAKGALTPATGAFTTAFSAIPVALLPPGVTTGTTADQFLALAPAVQTAVDALTGADLAALAAAVQTAESAVKTAQDTVDAVQSLVTALTDLLNAVLNAVTGNGDPLAALGNIKVTTSALAAKTPKAAADVSVGSVHVLGALTPLTSLTNSLGAVTDTLTSVLQSVAGVSFTAPSVSIGTPTKSTKTTGTTRFASASITGVKLTLPSLTLPKALTLPGVPTGISGSLTVGQLADAAQWTPGTAATPATPQTPNRPSQGNPLPDTGGRALLPVAGLLILGTGVLLWRRPRLADRTEGAA
jgi:hypothetical protein